jgi:hypothetical protein
MSQLAATIKHLSEGVKGFTINAAVKNIEGWEATLHDMDTPGAKGIARDLEHLKKLLQHDKIDSDAVKALMSKLGEAMAKLAGKADSKHADQVKHLGEALFPAA